MMDTFVVACWGGVVGGVIGAAVMARTLTRAIDNSIMAKLRSIEEEGDG